MLKMELDATFTVHFLQLVKLALWLPKYERVLVQGGSTDRCESKDSRRDGMASVATISVRMVWSHSRKRG